IEVDPETEATFEYRPYLGWSKQTFRVPYLPELRAVRGTKVNLAYFSNRPLKGARLDMRFGEGARAVKKTLDGVVDPKKPAVLLCPWFVLDPVGGHSHGRYRIAYTTREGESTTDTQAYRIEVLADAPPHNVVLTQPGKDIKLPANGILKVEGGASDDF